MAALSPCTNPWVPSAKWRALGAWLKWNLMGFSTACSIAPSTRILPVSTVSQSAAFPWLSGLKRRKNEAHEKNNGDSEGGHGETGYANRRNFDGTYPASFTRTE